MRGIPRSLARRRSASLSNLAYAIDARIDLDTWTLRGTITIDVSLARRSALRIDSRPVPGGNARVVSVNDRAVPRSLRRSLRDADHLVVPASWLRPGANRIVCGFVAPVRTAGTALTRYDDREDGAHYVYSLVVPADASSVFPCFDQPDLKGRFSLALDVPAGWTVVANAPLVARRAGRHVFAATTPLSTYLFAFAAGPFRAQSGGQRGTRVFVRRSQAARARPAVAETVALSDASLEFCERWTGRKLPFAKHDLVLVPEFQYGGMEHAGAVFLREEAILLARDASASERLRRALLVAHENAHLWFGDCVTMRWFDDLWLKEGFANLLAAKAVQAIAPGLDPWVASVAQRAAACATDRTRGTRPLVGPVANLLDAKAAYGAIVYQKGPAVLRMTERRLGAAIFRRGVREWLATHAFASADWRDLVRSLERASGRKLDRWADAWITSAGVPRVRLALDVDARGCVRRARLTQSGTRRPVPLAFDVACDDARGCTRVLPVVMQRRDARIAALEGRPPPRRLLLDATGDAYGLFVHDAAAIDAAFERLPRERDAVTRALVIEAGWNGMRDGQCTPAALVARLLDQLPREPNETLAATILDRLAALLRRHLDIDAHDALQSRAEAMLLAASLNRQRSPSARAAARCTWITTVRSDAGLAALRDALAGSEATARERVAMIGRLVIVGAPGAATLLARVTANARTDDARRMAFAAHAGLADPRAKRALLGRFLRDRSLPEAWIEAALPAFAAPEHAALVRPLVPRAIAALPHLERRFRIFFVNRWVGAILASQADAAGLAVVDRSLQTTHLAQPLRSKVLEARDELATVVAARSRRPARHS